MEFRRNPTNQDISWFLDLERSKQLDLDPPYQRRSVWTSKDRKFFLDTIFRGYPSPAIYLNKEMSRDGEAVYHVVDGKQRLETILMFSRGEIKIGNDFGDNRLDGKKWEQISDDLKQEFWNYIIPVEMINFTDVKLVTEVFDRLNRNSRKLTRQELRHAKFDGWFANFVEEEITNPVWKTIGLVKSREDKRMDDVQRLSELLLMVLEHEIMGFDQDTLDELYAKYDDLEDEVLGLRTEGELSDFEFKDYLEDAKNYLLEMERSSKEVFKYTRTMLNLYSLWSVVVLDKSTLPGPEEASKKYTSFIESVKNFPYFPNQIINSHKSLLINKYQSNSQGASTDLRQRKERYEVLKEVITGHENTDFN